MQEMYRGITQIGKNLRERLPILRRESIVIPFIDYEAYLFTPETRDNPALLEAKLRVFTQPQLKVLQAEMRRTSGWTDEMMEQRNNRPLSEFERLFIAGLDAMMEQDRLSPEEEAAIERHAKEVARPATLADYERAMSDYLVTLSAGKRKRVEVEFYRRLKNNLLQVSEKKS